MKKLFLCLASLLVCGGVFLFCPHLAKAADLIIDQDTSWSSGEVKIFDNGDNLIISPGVTLEVSGGTTIKMGTDSSILVSGSLYLQGTTEKPVVITSIKDDSFGGDSNGDGTSNIPAKGDWGGIVINSNASSSKPEFVADYSVIKYGGRFQGSSFNYFQVVNAGKFQISHSDLLDNDQFIYILGADSASINYSNIYNPTQPIWYMKDYYISYGIYREQTSTMDVANNYWGSAEGPTTLADAYAGRIKGSILYHGNFSYAPFATSAIPLFAPKPKLNPVILIPGILGSWPDVSGKWELDPILHTYDNLWSALKSAGYQEGENLFALPYNWRQSNVETAHELKTKIEAVKTICHCDKVDLIGHSMGGLVARQYIESNEYGNDVDKVVFLATPHRGATKAYLMWEGGSVGVDLFSNLAEKIFWVEGKFNGYNSVGQYIRNAPIESVRELLPIYNYLRDKGSDVLRPYPDNYPSNPFLESLNNAGLLYKLNTVKIYNFLGDVGETSTITNLRVVSSTGNNGDWANGYPENYDSKDGYHGLEFGSGDQTVPTGSNSSFADQFDININSDHGHIVTDAQKAVIKDLTGIEPASEVRNNYIYNLLMVRIFSPADFMITAPDGRKLGLDSGSSSTVNEIPLAFYNHDGGQFAVIPNPINGEYKVNLRGTGVGEYKLSLSYLSESGESQDKDFAGNIFPGQNQEFKINYTSSSEPLSELEPQDSIAPMINISSPTSSGQYFRTLLPISYVVTDDFSGVSSTVLTLDNQPLVTSTLDLFDYAVGVHELKVIATDKSGNVSSSSVSFEIITDLEHSLSDLEIMKQKKWISNLIGTTLQAGLKLLQVKLKAIDFAISLASHSEKLKAKLLTERKNIISNSMGDLNKYLDYLLSQKKINQKVYDIIKANNNYLKINL